MPLAPNIDYTLLGAPPKPHTCGVAQLVEPHQLVVYIDPIVGDTLAEWLPDALTPYGRTTIHDTTETTPRYVCTLSPTVSAGDVLRYVRAKIGQLNMALRETEQIGTPPRYTSEDFAQFMDTARRVLNISGQDTALLNYFITMRDFLLHFLPDYLRVPYQQALAALYQHDALSLLEDYDDFEGCQAAFLQHVKADLLRTAQENEQLEVE